jgi:tRNA (cytidine32/uridine32-2'-O)-methyltransferase
MAVQTLSYEVRTSFLIDQQKEFKTTGENLSKNLPKKIVDEEEQFPIMEETERFYQHFEDALKATGFITPSHPGLVMTKLRRLFTRARPDVKEVKMMRGILASVQRAAKVNDKKENKE